MTYRRRVVITGLGIVSCIGNDLETVAFNLHYGKSGIKFQPNLKELAFRCQVAGIPEDVTKAALFLFDDDTEDMESSNRYGCIAAVRASHNAGIHSPKSQGRDPKAGVIMGSAQIHDPELNGRAFIDKRQVRRLGSKYNDKTVLCGPAARTAYFLNLGNRVEMMNTTSCSGLSSIVNGFRHVRDGYADRMLCGATKSSSVYGIGPLDSMRVLASKHNEEPEKASRPMSESACGFVPSSGAAVVHIETLERATERGVMPYAEIVGAQINCGAQADGGSMTAPSKEGMIDCIHGAISDSEGQIRCNDIDLINGHLTGTFADPIEVKVWKEALESAWIQFPKKFPFIHSTKSIMGHATVAAGAIEAVACCLMLRKGFVHPSINCEDLHPDLEEFRPYIITTGQEVPNLKTIITANFGFGDINSCMILRSMG